MASIGVKAWRCVVGQRGARAPPRRAVASASRASMRCAGALAQRHAPSSRPAPCSRPSRRRRPAARRAAARRSARRPAQRPPARWAPGAARPAAATRVVGACAVRSQSASERPICSVCWRSSALSRVCRTQSLSARDARQVMRAARRRRPGPAPAGRRAPGSGAAGRSSQSPACASSRHQAGLDRGFQALGVAEAAHRQGRRGQPHQLQQRAASACRRGARGRAPWSWPWSWRVVMAVLVRRGRAPWSWPWRMAVRHGRGRRRHRRRPRARTAPALRCTIRCIWRSMSASTWSGSSFRWSGLQLQRHVAVAQVVGGAQQVERRAVLGCSGAPPAPAAARPSRAPASRPRPPARRRRAPRCRAAGTRPARGRLESVASKRLFWRTSQSSSTLAARLSSTAARPRPWGMSLLTVSMGESGRLLGLRRARRRASITFVITRRSCP